MYSEGKEKPRSGSEKRSQGKRKKVKDWLAKTDLAPLDESTPGRKKTNIKGRQYAIKHNYQAGNKCGF